MYVGYEIQWGNLSLPSFPSDTLSHGAFYSYMCHDEVPFIDEAALEQAAGDRPWYVDAYVDNPYRAICDRWDVGAAEADPHDPLTSDIPSLLFVGQFDPFSPLPLVRQAAKGLSNSWVIKVPNWGRNVLGAAGSECMVNIRNAFIEDPTTLADSSCVTALEPFDSYGHHEFLLPPPPTVSPGPRDAVITTVAGDGALGSSGDGSPATRAQIVPVDVAVDADGNLYVLEFDGERVRRVDVSSRRISTAVGPPTGIAPPPPGAASTVQFPGATALGIDAQGNLYVGLGGDHVITRIDPSGDTTIIAGTGEGGYSGDGGPATQAELSVAKDIAVDDQGDVYFTDFFHHRIRKIDTDGIITTVAGTGEKGFSGDGGPATQAQLARPGAIFVDGKGTIYFFDSGNHRIRHVDRHGIISTVGGNGERGCPRDGRAATKASLYGPVVKNAEGDLYVTNENCNRIWKVNADGSFTTVAGTGIPGYSGDGGPADLAGLYAPARIALGPDGSLYVADWLSFRVRKVVIP